MAVMNNPVIGEIDCLNCDGKCTVHQTKRGKKNLLYTRCNSCGTDQRTGARVQERLFYQSTWRDEAPVMPPGIEVRDLTMADIEPKAVPQTAVVEPDIDAGPTTETTEGKSGFARIALVLAAIAGGVALWVKG